ETNPPPSTGPTIVRITTPQPPVVTTTGPSTPTTKNVVATDVHPNVAEPASPLVAKITPVADLGDCDQIVFGGGNANAVAAIKLGQNEDTVTFFAGNPLVKKWEGKFDVEKNVKQ